MARYRVPAVSLARVAILSPCFVLASTPSRRVPWTTAGDVTVVCADASTTDASAATAAAHRIPERADRRVRMQKASVETVGVEKLEVRLTGSRVSPGVRATRSPET